MPYPLSDSDFAVLEDRGRVTFPIEVRVELNRKLAELCGPAGDTLVHAERKAAAEALVGLARNVEGVLAALDRLNRFAAWKLFPIERKRVFGATHVTGEALAQPFSVDVVAALLRTMHRHADRVARELAPPKGRKGLPPNMWFEYFILIVATAFTAAGGTASAAQSGLEGEDGKRHRETPFLRVLRFIHERLPAGKRAPSVKALDERAARTLGLLARSRNQGKNQK